MNSTQFLDVAALEELKNYDTPTVANALDYFGIRSRTAGFMSPRIRSQVTSAKPMVGYTVTAKCSASTPPTDAQMKLLRPYYEALRGTPQAVAVIQDTDPTPVGSFWGEVNVSIHKALGCVGTVTEGGVRDLNEVEELDFGYFSACILVSHGYVHLEDVDCPVEVGGMTVYPGELIHADRHGVLVVPAEAAPSLAEACRAAAHAEEPVITRCREAFSKGELVQIDDLMQWRKEMVDRRNQATVRFTQE